MEEDIYDLIVVGCGVAGPFFASNNDSNGRKAVICNTKPGLKFLISGNGKGNITNGEDIKDFIYRYGDKGKRIRKLLYNNSNIDMIKYFDDIGIKTYIREEDNKVFPNMGIRDVLDKLIKKMRSNNFEIINEVEIIDIDYDGKSTYTLVGNEGSIFKASRVVIATGGKSYPKTGSNGRLFEVLARLGLKINTLKPSLTPIYVRDYPYRDLSGVSFKNVRLRVYGDNKRYEEISDILLAHEYFSGPGILNISRYCKEGYNLVLDYCIGIDRERLFSLINRNKDKSFINNVSLILKEEGILISRRFLESLFERSKLNKDIPVRDIGKKDINKLITLLKEDSFCISGVGDFSKAMVTSGGVDLDEIDLSSMEVKKYKGLYVIGEALDVAGDTGGYNIQLAFSSALGVNLS